MEGHLVIEPEYRAKLHHDLFPHSEWDSALDNTAVKLYHEMSLSLQHLCRRVIIRSIGMNNVCNARQLPLPPPLKQFLTTFYMPQDIEITRMNYRQYAVHHSRYPCHTTHQVYNGMCKIDYAAIIIKCHSDAEINCKACMLLGEKMRFAHDSQVWKTVNHPNIQKCLLCFTNTSISKKFYLIETPHMSLKELVHNLRCNENTIPEYLLWNCIARMTSALVYLNDKGIHAEFMDTHHWHLDIRGNLKLENILMDMCGEGSTHYTTRGECCYPDNIWKSPEEIAEQVTDHRTPLWGLGCISYELANLHPAARVSIKASAFSRRRSLVRPVQVGQSMTIRGVTRNGPRYNLPHSLVATPVTEKYSEDFRMLIARLMAEASLRPPILTVKVVSQRNIAEFGAKYNGPKNLIRLIEESEYKEDIETECHERLIRMTI